MATTRLELKIYYARPALCTAGSRKEKAMKCYVIGKRKLDFTASDGKAVKGLSLYLGMSSDSDSLEGMEAGRFYIPESKLPKEDIMVGTDIEVYFDRRGKIDSIVVG